MVQSASIKSLHTISSSSINQDEEQIKELLHWIIDRVEKDSAHEETPLILFDASSSIHRKNRLASGSDDVFSNSDNHKHSSTILIDDKTPTADLHRNRFNT